MMERQLRTGYLTSQYPAPSHTFIRREILALRRHGADINTYSVRRPINAEVMAADDQAALEDTGYILPPSPMALVSAQIRAVISQPLNYIRTLRLALRHRAPGFRSFIWALFHFLEAILLASWLKRDRIEHLHNHFANSGATVGLLATHFLGIDWSLTLHGISETDYPAGLLLPEKVTHAKFVCCVSNFGRAQAMRITPPAEWGKFQIVRCGIDLSSLPQTQAEVAARRSTRTIICVGRLSPEKAQAGLLTAFQSIAEQHPGWQVQLVGDGPDRASLEALVRQVGLTDRVTFSGRLAEQATLAAIANADMLVLPSFMEGLPVVLMEAMALGTPVISSCVAGIPELVRDEHTGLLFPASDWGKLAQAIDRLIRDPELGQKMAEAGKRRIDEEFNIDEAVAPLARLFGIKA